MPKFFRNYKLKILTELNLADCFTQLQQEIEDNPEVSSAELIHQFQTGPIFKAL